jgi:uncharacterized protein (TIGR02996 family)
LALAGQRLISVEHIEEEGLDDAWGGTSTTTAFIFKTDADTVVSKWIGESNGYYSESVQLEEVFCHYKDVTRIANMFGWQGDIGDSAGRLAFADWLEERGSGFGAFIRKMQEVR